MHFVHRSVLCCIEVGSKSNKRLYKTKIEDSCPIYTISVFVTFEHGNYPEFWQYDRTILVHCASHPMLKLT